MPFTADTSEAVAVATPLRWQRKLSAVRSLVSRPRAGPLMVAIVCRAPPRCRPTADLDLDRGRNHLEGATCDVEAGDDTRLAGAQRERGALIGGNDRVRGDVAGAAEIFEQRGLDQRFIHQRQ